MERPKIVEAWPFDGSRESVEQALKENPRLSYAWRAGGDGILTWGKYTIRAGSWLARLSDGSLQPRSEKTVRKAGFALPEEDDYDEEGEAEEEWDIDDEMAPLRRDPIPRRRLATGVRAWFFDGTEESIREALDTHEELNFVKHPDGNYVVHAVYMETDEKRPYLIKRRYQPGKCLVLMSDGSFSRWQYRRCQRQGLVPRRPRE